MRLPRIFTMGHTQAAAEHQRPTLEELALHNAYERKHSKLHAILRGLWDDSEEHFEVVVKGDFDDVIEVFETLKENGNLMGIEMHEVNS